MIEVHGNDQVIECTNVYYHDIDSTFQIIVDINDLYDDPYLEFFLSTTVVSFTDDSGSHSYKVDRERSSYFVRYDIYGNDKSQIIINFFNE